MNYTNDSNSTKSSTKDIVIRLIIVIIGIAIWMTYRFSFLYEEVPVWNFKYCFDDRITTHLLINITRWLGEHRYVLNFIIILGMGLLDVLFITYLIFYAFKVHTWQTTIHFALFYLFRALALQSLFLFEFYDMYIWGEPGFPSLIVPYFRTPDFFYSGHAGIAIIIGLHFRDHGYEEMFYFSMILCAYMSVVMTATRAHFGLDIIFGIIVANYFYYLSLYFAKYLDKKIPVCKPKNENSKNITFRNNSSSNNNSIEIDNNSDGIETVSSNQNGNSNSGDANVEVIDGNKLKKSINSSK